MGELTIWGLTDHQEGCTLVIWAQMRPDNILARDAKHLHWQREPRWPGKPAGMVRSVAAKRHCTPLQLGVSGQSAVGWHAVGHRCTDLGAVVFWKEPERISDLEKLVGFRRSSAPQRSKVGLSA